jgi:hypothetical protein
MLTNEQINEIYRLHFVENWTVRKIVRHLHIGRRTVAKYLIKPAQAPSHRTRTSKKLTKNPRQFQGSRRAPHGCRSASALAAEGDPPVAIGSRRTAMGENWASARAPYG